jgi:sulfoxide reductase heme-binding subunit YedZ
VAPLVWLAGRAALGNLGADPIAEVLNRLGLYTLCTLLAALACTPLQLVFGWKWPVRVRRMIGLFAFWYAALHLTTYAVVDQGLAFGDSWRDVVKRPFITVGFAAFLVLLALAVTSPQRMVLRLGFRSWKRLHRLVYLAGALGCLHFLWRFKLKEPEPKLAFAVLAALLAVRVFGWVRTARKARGTSASRPRPTPVV